MPMKIETLVRKLIGRFKDEFNEEKATEIVQARDAIIQVLKEREVSLPGACFALDLVKEELLRAQLEEFLGNVKIVKGSLPLKVK